MELWVWIFFLGFVEVGEWGGCDKPCQLATTKRVGGGGKKPGAGQVIPATISPHCKCPHQAYSYSLLKGEWLSASIILNGHLAETPFICPSVVFVLSPTSLLWQSNLYFYSQI